MKQYLEPLAHIAKAQKKEWSVVKLGKSLSNAFQIGDQIAIFTICLNDPPEEIELKYIPVCSKLQVIANKLGDYLHLPGEERAESQKWIETLSALVREGLLWLEFAASGELIGVPLLNSKTRQTDLRLVMSGDDPRAPRLKRLQQGTEHVIKVRYLSLPGVPPLRNEG